MYHPDSVVNIHKKVLKDAGLEHLKFRELRRTFATTALQNGVDVKTVSAMLGHYDAGFTLSTYTHATRRPAQLPSVIVSFIPLLLFFNYASLRWVASEKGGEITIMDGADFETKCNVLCKCLQ